jgi:vanillate O-demethylase monooxygenase subunit
MFGDHDRDEIAMEAERKQFFAEPGLKAFKEDKVMIEAQQRVIAATPHPRMMPMVTDEAVLTYEGVLKRLLREEAAGLEPETASA